MWALFGIVAGIVAYISDDKKVRGGVIGAIFMGIFGALTGGLTADFLFGVEMGSFDFPAFIIAICGAIFLILIQHTILSTD